MSLKNCITAWFVLLFFLPAGLNAQAAANEKQAQDIGLNVSQVIEADDSLDLFAKSLKKTKMMETLQLDGPYTVFISNNDAFNRVSFAKKFKTWTNADLLKNVVNYHIVEGVWTTEQLMQMNFLPTLQGADLEISISDNGLLIGGAPVLTGDISATNGIVHIVSEVIEQPDF